MGRIASALFLLAAPVVFGQQTKLDPFVGKDLWKAPYAGQVSLDRIVDPVPKGFWLGPAPWHVWKTTRQDQTRYIVLLGESLAMIPGGTTACIQLFDAQANRIASWSFQTGWRINLTDAEIEYSGDLASDLIVLHVAPVISGRNVAKEYFSLGHDRLRFVRVEDDKGQFVQNDYVFPNSEIGIVPEARTVDEWIGLLESKDKAEVLSALVFLGGRHIDEPERSVLPGQHESEYAPLFKEVSADARIRDLVERLTESDDAWIRDGALHTPGWSAR